MNAWFRYALAPFYSDARRMLRLPGWTVDKYLVAGATASITGGDVTFALPDGSTEYAKVRVLGRRRAARWVNQFNGRAVRQDHPSS